MATLAYFGGLCSSIRGQATRHAHQESLNEASINLNRVEQAFVFNSPKYLTGEKRCNCARHIKDFKDALNNGESIDSLKENEIYQHITQNTNRENTLNYMQYLLQSHCYGLVVKEYESYLMPNDGGLALNTDFQDQIYTNNLINMRGMFIVQYHQDSINEIVFRVLNIFGVNGKKIPNTDGWQADRCKIWVVFDAFSQCVPKLPSTNLNDQLTNFNSIESNSSSVVQYFKIQTGIHPHGFDTHAGGTTTKTFVNNTFETGLKINTWKDHDTRSGIIIKMKHLEKFDFPEITKTNRLFSQLCLEYIARHNKSPLLYKACQTKAIGQDQNKYYHVLWMCDETSKFLKQKQRKYKYIAQSNPQIAADSASTQFQQNISRDIIEACSAVTGLNELVDNPVLRELKMTIDDTEVTFSRAITEEERRAMREQEEQARRAEQQARLAEEQARLADADRIAAEKAQQEAANAEKEQQNAAKIQKLQEKARLAEERARLAEERARQEEAARLAAEKARQEAARLAAEKAEAERFAARQQAREQAQKNPSDTTSKDFKFAVTLEQDNIAEIINDIKTFKQKTGKKNNGSVFFRNRIVGQNISSIADFITDGDTSPPPTTINTLYFSYNEDGERLNKFFEQIKEADQQADPPAERRKIKNRIMNDFFSDYQYLDLVPKLLAELCNCNIVMFVDSSMLDVTIAAKEKSCMSCCRRKIYLPKHGETSSIVSFRKNLGDDYDTHYVYCTKAPNSNQYLISYCQNQPDKSTYFCDRSRNTIRGDDVNGDDSVTQQFTNLNDMSVMAHRYRDLDVFIANVNKLLEPSDPFTQDTENEDSLQGVEKGIKEGYKLQLENKKQKLKDKELEWTAYLCAVYYGFDLCVGDTTVHHTQNPRAFVKLHRTQTTNKYLFTYEASFLRRRFDSNTKKQQILNTVSASFDRAIDMPIKYTVGVPTFGMLCVLLLMYKKYDQDSPCYQNPWYAAILYIGILALIVVVTRIVPGLRDDYENKFELLDDNLHAKWVKSVLADKEKDLEHAIIQGPISRDKNLMSWIEKITTNPKLKLDLFKSFSRVKNVYSMFTEKDLEKDAREKEKKQQT